MIDILLLLLALMTGVDRPQSELLMQVAQNRSAEIVVDFNHRSLTPELSDWSWGEVIGFNSGYSDPVTAIAQGWESSPVHWNVLTDPFYEKIGCGITFEPPRYYYVCIVGTQSLPNTAMDGSLIALGVLMLLMFALGLLIGVSFIGGRFLE